MIAEFFVYQLPLFCISGLMLFVIYHLDLGEIVERVLLIVSLSLMVSTPFLIAIIMTRKYKSTVKKVE